METEAIRHTITGSDTEVLENRELDEVLRELISNVEIDEKQDQWPDQTDNQEVVQRFRIYSDAETDAFLKESKNKNTGQKTKSDMKIVTDFFRPGYNPFLWIRQFTSQILFGRKKEGF